MDTFISGIFVGIICSFDEQRFGKGCTTLFTHGVLFSIFIWLFLNLHFYSRLLEYQAGNTLECFIKSYSTDNRNLACYKPDDYSYSLCTGCAILIPKWILANIKKQFLQHNPLYLFQEEPDYQKLLKAGIPMKTISQAEDYHITRLTGSF